jgi:hypothetical protein
MVRQSDIHGSYAFWPMARARRNAAPQEQFLGNSGMN